MLWLLYNSRNGEGYVYGNEDVALYVRAFLGPEWEVYPLA